MTNYDNLNSEDKLRLFHQLASDIISSLVREAVLKALEDAKNPANARLTIACSLDEKDTLEVRKHKGGVRLTFRRGSQSFSETLDVLETRRLGRWLASASEYSNFASGEMHAYFGDDGAWIECPGFSVRIDRDSPERHDLIEFLASP